jgi:hypothetical protein
MRSESLISALDKRGARAPLPNATGCSECDRSPIIGAPAAKGYKTIRMRAKKALASASSAQDEEARIDACDVDLRTGDATRDEDLPAARGGVEVSRRANKSRRKGGPAAASAGTARRKTATRRARAWRSH